MTDSPKSSALIRRRTQVVHAQAGQCEAGDYEVTYGFKHGPVLGIDAKGPSI